MLENKLHEELNRFRAINKYVTKLIVEQEEPETDLPPLPGEEGDDLPPVEGGDDADLGGDMGGDFGGDLGGDMGGDFGGGGGGDMPDAGDLPAGGDDDDMPEVGDDIPEMNDTEEIDITDLVNMTKNIKKDLDDRKGEQNDAIGKMDSVFSKLDDLESKLSQMDSVLEKIDMLGHKIEDMREKRPEEKLEMRSLDSYPFNQKPSDFFDDKKIEMRSTGKNEYVLTKNDVQSYSDREMKQSFNPRMGNE